MKKYLLGALITFTGLFALAPGAQAQTGNVVVHIQQEFVAAGKTLPAGTYRIYQGSRETGQVLILRGEAPGTSAFLMPTSRDEALPERAHVKLTRVGDVYYLSEVASESGVYTLAPPRIVRRTARARGVDGMSSSGSH